MIYIKYIILYITLLYCIYVYTKRQKVKHMKLIWKMISAVTLYVFIKFRSDKLQQNK